MLLLYSNNSYLMTAIQRALKKYFGFDNFRPMQEDIINSVLEGKDSLVVMPTGGGKSMCYQIPAIVMPGVAIVISPLIALMKDQVEGLLANGVGAAFLNSSQSQEQQNYVLDLLSNNKLKLLYISPEKLLTQDFYYLLMQINISLFAVDEAHCISVWGHDFRPEYAKMSFLKKQFPMTPLIALTATADNLTQKDIVNQLGIVNFQKYLSSFDRPNLSLQVLPGREKYKTILGFIRQRPHQSGIIYCLSRKSTESLSKKLRTAGVNVNYYHAGLSAQERNIRQEDFITDKVPIICATLAFGMGIDKSNVRWVIHNNLPKNIESYYQEIGRAGRDGLKADTILFYSYSDVIIHKKFNEQSSLKDVVAAKLERIQQYCDARICRRKILLSYFGEYLQEDCGNCDVCKNPPKLFDGTLIAQKALSAIMRMKEQVPAGMLIDVLRGSTRQEIIDKSYNKIKTYGVGRDVLYPDWQQYILQLLNMGYISVAYDQSNALKLAEQSKDVLFKSKKVELVALSSMSIPEEKSSPSQKTTKQISREGLFELLRKLRLKLSKDQKIAPYLIFSDVSLHEMAEVEPRTEDEMMLISGVGERKYQLYGDLFINEIINYRDNKNQEAKKTSKSFYETYEFYKQGFSIEEIASIKKINILTVYSHLSSLYEKGADINIYEYVTSEEIEMVRNTRIKYQETNNLKDLYIYLNEELDYYKIRLALSHIKLFTL